MGRRAETEAALRAILELRVRAGFAAMSLGDLAAAIERKQRCSTRPVLCVISGGKSSSRR